MKPDGMCIYKGINEECKCSECSKCEHYQKLFLKELRLEQQEQM